MWLHLHRGAYQREFCVTKQVTRMYALLMLQKCLHCGTAGHDRCGTGRNCTMTRCVILRSSSFVVQIMKINIVAAIWNQLLAWKVFLGLWRLNKPTTGFLMIKIDDLNHHVSE